MAKGSKNQKKAGTQARTPMQRVLVYKNGVKARLEWRPWA